MGSGADFQTLTVTTYGLEPWLDMGYGISQDLKTPRRGVHTHFASINPISGRYDSMGRSRAKTIGRGNKRFNNLKSAILSFCGGSDLAYHNHGRTY